MVSLADTAMVVGEQETADILGQLLADSVKFKGLQTWQLGSGQVAEASYSPSDKAGPTRRQGQIPQEVPWVKTRAGLPPGLGS